MECRPHNCAPGGGFPGQPYQQGGAAPYTGQRGSVHLPPRPAPFDACRASMSEAYMGDARQAKELAMSPKTRAVYKDFSHKLRSKDTQSKGMRHAQVTDSPVPTPTPTPTPAPTPTLILPFALTLTLTLHPHQDLAQRCMAELPECVHWRVDLEMADLCKREKRFRDARLLYARATERMPNAPQTWLEYAKMEEERGHFRRCQHILTAGLQHCPLHEALLLKAIKHLERIGELEAARGLLGQLRGVPVDKSWRTLLEGALLEARAARTDTARRIFKYLLQQAPWYGPVWHEACRFEHRCNHLHEALHVAEQGLLQLPRYGPLWFCALRLQECTSQKHDLMRATRTLVERGVRHISKDLVWKLWFESAQVEERAGFLHRSRAAYVKSVGTCAANLRWKVWLGGARTELCHQQIETSQALLERAYEESPPKTRAIVMLEQSRLHELRGNVEQARKLLKGARRTNKQEWKVFLESVLLELRNQSIGRALREARKALDVHRGTGRLWAVLIQLEQQHGVEQQLRVFQQALNEVPKSGEVWCEGARIFLNPHSACFNLHVARRFLNFAIEFTPQYGDSFIEYLRLQMLVASPEAAVERLWQLCINAEPNYGVLWFHCKPSVLLTTRQVLQSATELLGAELAEWKAVYAAAAARAQTAAFRATAEALVQRVDLMAADAGAVVAAGQEEPPPPPPLPLPPPLEVVGMAPSTTDAADFVTGSVALNRMHRAVAQLSFEERRTLIYGGDMIVP